MFNKNEVCQKITEFNPDLAACDIDIDTYYSAAKKSWIIRSQKGDHVWILGGEYLETISTRIRDDQFLTLNDDFGDLFILDHGEKTRVADIGLGLVLLVE